MADDVDVANERVDAERERAIAAACRHKRPTVRPADDCCTSCGEPIGAARLEALPDADDCIECARDDEQRARQWKR